MIYILLAIGLIFLLYLVFHFFDDFYEDLTDEEKKDVCDRLLNKPFNWYD
jgi:hypothetical protein